MKFPKGGSRCSINIPKDHVTTGHPKGSALIPTTYERHAYEATKKLPDFSGSALTKSSGLQLNVDQHPSNTAHNHTQHHGHNGAISFGGFCTLNFLNGARQFQEELKEREQAKKDATKIKVYK